MDRNLQLFADRTLIEHFQATQRNAYLEVLYDRYLPKVIAYCVTLVEDQVDANDLAQEIFYKVTKSITKLTNPQTFVAWLFQIARNTCMDFLRQKSKSRYDEMNQGFDFGEDDLDLETLYADDHRMETLWRYFQEMDPADQDILRQKYLNQMSIKELQQHYQLSASAVKMRLARSRKRLLARMVTN